MPLEPFDVEISTDRSSGAETCARSASVAASSASNTISLRRFATCIPVSDFGFRVSGFNLRIYFASGSEFGVQVRSSELRVQGGYERVLLLEEARGVTALLLQRPLARLHLPPRPFPAPLHLRT